METARRHGSLPSWRFGDEVGATMVEYGLVLALVALVAAAGAALVGQGVSQTLGNAAASVTGVAAEDAGGPLPPQLPVPEEEAGAGEPAAAAKSGGPNANSENGANHSNGSSAHNK